MKKILKNLTIGITGEFGEPRSHKNLQRWIEMNDGTHASVIDENTTHLVCTLEDFRKKTLKVKQALKFKHLKIVTFDWLEDSLMSGRVKREKRYLVAALEKQKRKQRLEKNKQEQAAVKRFRDGCAGSEEDTLSKAYHIYRDETLFEYNITLGRADLSTNRVERYHLKLYESNALPHLYAVSARFTKAGSSARVIVAPLASFFDVAFQAFEKFFRKKTGIEWASRLNRCVVEDGRFVYEPPVEGRPRGRMPDCRPHFV
ncbi:MAG: hypothetical protein M1837_005067 [Sclerophora amabilis]|nr:MAG: hypothetical protein M1837_005067 [Sclerophora amabilis]